MTNGPRPWYRRRWGVAAMLVIGVAATWLAVQLRWIRHRHEFLGREAVGSFFRADARHAPGALAWFGEEGIKTIWLELGAHDTHSAEAARLFPEAEILENTYSHFSESERSDRGWLPID